MTMMIAGCDLCANGKCVGVLELFKGDTACAAVILAVAAFLLGMVVMCALCRLVRPCGKKRACGGDSRQVKKDDSNRPFEKRKPHPAPADGSVEIYVGNLSYEMSEDQLRKEFEAFGKVGLVRIVTNRINGKSKGFGFVQMPVRAEAEAAISALNDKELLGRKLRCNEAKNVI